ncbi:MAG: NAD-dependent epimerase/dehydratase family protein [Candidatus Lindowbacteria bacterium]|nr:NAD-dependent epimerase/dehydratase family protein [Candidatus Lindowbacteria bacterium]
MKRESGANGSSSHEIVNLSPCEMLDRAKMDDEILYPTGVFHENMILSIDAFNASLRTNYPISKLALEALGVSYAKEFGMRITVVRLFNTTGPRQTGRYGMVAPRFVAQAVAGEPITVYGDGTQCRCFCDVRDVVLALDMLASNPSSAGEIVNVGHNREIAYGRKFEETYHRRPSLEKLFRLTGFKHKWTLEQTLDVLIEIERRSPRVSEADTRWQRSHIS